MLITVLDMVFGSFDGFGEYNGVSLVELSKIIMGQGTGFFGVFW